MSQYIFPIDDILWRKGCEPRACPTCKKVMLVRLACVKGHKRTFCSRTCMTRLVSATEKICSKCEKVKKLDHFPTAKHTNSGYMSWCKECTQAMSKKIQKKRKKEWLKNPNKKLCSIKGCTNIAGFEHPRCGVHQYGIKEVPNPFKGKQEKFADKIIPYRESLSGKAYIGVAKAPLMKVERGHGFLGVLLQNETRDMVQCHHCGEWRRALCAHVKKCTGLNVHQYQEKYGLTFQTGLTSDADSMNRTKRMLSGEIYSFQKGNKHTPHKTYAHNTRKVSMAEMNRTGTCPLQVQARIVEFIHTNRELPRTVNRGAKIYQLLSKRFGSFKEAMQHYGLPHPVRNGRQSGGYHRETPYMFPNTKIYKFDTRDPVARDIFYQKMCKECPILSEKIS